MKKTDLENEPARIGVFGGSFDPPHIAHFICARIVAEKLDLQKVLVIPTAIQPHKLSGANASPEIRWEMVKAAVVDDPLFEVSRMEIDRGGISYTIQTMEEVSAIYPSPANQLYYLLGYDALADINDWKDPQGLFKIANVVAMARPGNSLSGEESGLIRKATQVEIPRMEISSTLIRQRVKQDLSIRYMVPDAVRLIIDKYGLYKFNI